MNFEAPMTIQKAAHLLMFVRAVVVHDQVQFEIRLKFTIQSTQEFDELLVTMMRITFPAYLTADYVERSKQSRGAVSHVIVRPGAAAARRPTHALQANGAQLRAGVTGGRDQSLE